jgi:hypothetical protein
LASIFVYGVAARTKFEMMAGMILWPTFVTGAVGVAGIIGTILAARLTARSQTAGLVLYLTEQRERTRLADKRQVYANFLAGLGEVVSAAASAYYMEIVPEEKPGIVFRTSQARDNAFLRLGELELIAPKEVVFLAHVAFDLELDFSAQTVRNIDSLDESIIDSFSARIHEADKRLYESMRTDLGIEPRSPDK